MLVDFKIENNQIILDELESYANGIGEKLRKAIGTSLYAIEAAAKTNCPVDYGSLKQSITTEMSSEDLGGRVVCMENLQPFYGAYVEFGTGDYVDVPPDLIDYAWNFKGQKKVKGMKARPFLFPAFEAEIDNLNTKLQGCI